MRNRLFCGGGVLLTEYLILFFVGVHNQTLFFIKRNIVFYTLGIIASQLDLKFQAPAYNLLGLLGIVATVLNVVFVKNEIIDSIALVNAIKRLYALFGIPSIILYCCYIARYIERKKESIAKWLRTLGTQSYNIYLLHQPLCCAILGMVLFKLIGGNVLGDTLSFILCVIASLYIPNLIVRITYKIGLGRFMKLLLNVTD